MMGECKKLTPYLKANEIEHRFLCPYTSQQNGIAERKHHHIVDISLAILSHSSIPLPFWDDAFSTYVYLINRLSSPSLNWISLLEKLFHQTSNFSFLKNFGCLYYPCLRPYNNHKFQPRSIPCTFLGYSNIHKGYKCLSSDGRLYFSRHVLFDESTFPFSKSVSSTSSSTPPNLVTSTLSFSPSFPSVSLLLPTLKLLQQTYTILILHIQYLLVSPSQSNILPNQPSGSSVETASQIGTSAAPTQIALTYPTSSTTTTPTIDTLVESSSSEQHDVP